MTEAVIERLNSKKLELEERLDRQNQQWGSQRREALQYKIKKIEELIVSYRTAPLPTSIAEAEVILAQQIGFEEQKKKILTRLEIDERYPNIRRNSWVLCLVGPTGIGKSTFASLLAQALKKEFFAINLGGLSDVSVLLGTSENSFGTEIGQLAKALTETKKYDPLILLDEIDKAGSSSKTAIHDCLLNILDPEQNHEVLDYYLDIKLDFSHAIFVATANDLTKIPQPLRDRMLIVELPGYNIEQKKAITRKIIQNWFDQNEQLAPDNLEITAEALETLINKTNEKGVRQLKFALEAIFEYCLLQWTREVSQGETESKIIITPDLVNQIILQSFSNIHSHEEQKEREQLLHKELKSLRGEKDKLTNQLAKNNQSKLKASKFHALAVIKKSLNNAKLEKNKIILDNRNYEKEIKEANSIEEVEAIREEFLLGIMEKFPTQKKETAEKAKVNYSGSWSSNHDHKVLEKLVQEISKMNDSNIKVKNLEEQLTQIQEQNRHLEGQLNNFKQNSFQAKNLQSRFRNLEEQIKNSNWKIIIGFVLFIVIFLILVSGIIKLIYEKKRKK